MPCDHAGMTCGDVAREIREDYRTRKESGPLAWRDDYERHEMAQNIAPRNVPDLETIARRAYGWTSWNDGRVSVDDGAPDWVWDIFHAGTQDIDDDTRRDMVRDALGFIADNGDRAEDHDHEFADGCVSVYTADRREWLGSHYARQGFVDDAISELGWPGDLDSALGYGWYEEARQTFAAVLEAVRDVVVDMGGD